MEKIEKKPWSKEEIKFINDYKKTWSIKGLSTRINRTEDAVQSKLSEINKYTFDTIYNKAKTSAELSKKTTTKPRVFNKPTQINKTKSINIFWGLFKFTWK